MANRIEELPLYGKVLEFWEEVDAILKRSDVRRNRRLYEQIEEAHSSVDANLREGFEQPTDRAFSNFVFTAKGSTSEVIARIEEAGRKGLVTREDVARVQELGVPL